MDLINPDRPMHKPQFAALFFLAAFSLSYSLSRGFIAAKNGEVIPVYALAALAWASYLVAHYCAEGIFLHPIQSDSTLPTEPEDLALAALGGVILVAGVSFFVISVAQGHVRNGTIGGLVFFTGYVTIHYAVEDIIL